MDNLGIYEPGEGKPEIAIVAPPLSVPVNDGINTERLDATKNTEALAVIAGRENRELISALHTASEIGNSAEVDTIIKTGNNLFEKDKEWKAALDKALDIAFGRIDSRNHAAVAEKLILAGAVSDNPDYLEFQSYLAPAVKETNYNLRSADGMAPLHYMACKGYIGYLSFALERGANVNLKNASGASPLHEATRYGNLRVLEKLLDSGADINSQDAKGNSVLHLHMISRSPETTADFIKLLLDRGADPNIRDEHGDSPLHVAIILNRSSEVIRTLLEKGADVTIRNLDGKTPLYLAVEKNMASHILLLLNYKADIFAVDNIGKTPFTKALRENPHLVYSMITSETVLQNDSNGNTMLHLTVLEDGVLENSDTRIINAILDCRPSVINARNKEGDTGLTIAVRQNNEAAGKLLLSRGADIFTVNVYGESPIYLTFYPPESVSSDYLRWMITDETLKARDGADNTALHYAVQWRLDSWIPLLIEKGAATEAVNATGETPLFFAVRNNSPSTIRLLIANGALLVARDFLGNTVLHAAVRWNAYQGAQTIIGLGFDVNCHAFNGKTPLHDSIRLGMQEMQALLITNGADIEIRDKEGNTPFMEAVMAGNQESMEMLAKRDADTNMRNFKGDTPLHVSAAINRIDISTLLLSWGVSIHARNAEGRTPFQIALNRSDSMLVKTFLTRDRINSSDDFGLSLLHIAVQENAALDIIELILDLGARPNSVDPEGRTPLRLALDLYTVKMDLNHLQTAALLVNYKSDIFYAARDGKTPVDICLADGEATVRALFSGSSLKAKDSSGNTVLHYAARLGDTEMVKLLLEMGAEKDIRNTTFESPADIAKRWGKSEAADLLN